MAFDPEVSTRKISFVIRVIEATVRSVQALSLNVDVSVACSANFTAEHAVSIGNNNNEILKLIFCFVFFIKFFSFCYNLDLSMSNGCASTADY